MIQLKTRLILALRNPAFDRDAVGLGRESVPPYLTVGPGAILSYGNGPEECSAALQLMRSGQCDPACEESLAACHREETVTGVDGIVRPTKRALTEERSRKLELIYRKRQIGQSSPNQSDNTSNAVYMRRAQELREHGVETDGMDYYDIHMTWRSVVRDGQRVIPAEEFNALSGEASPTE